MTTNALSIELASGDALDVREFSVEEGMSQLFDVLVTAVSSSAEIDFDASIGAPARFEILRTSPVDGETRYWNGICMRAGQTRVEEAGLSTYAIRIVPTMWLLTQRRNYRIFQDKSELDVVLELLAEWGIQPALRLDAGSYTKRRIRIQYAETDFDFVNRLLEDIGVAYYFEQAGGDTQLTLVDAPNNGPRRAPVSFIDQPNERVAVEYATAVRTHREVRPGRYTQSDVDYRKPLGYPLAASASQGSAVEGKLERYHHNYGSFLWKADGGGDTPVADDRGPARTNEREGAKQVQKRLDAQRIDARVVTFRTIAHDLRPGKVFTIGDHPRNELSAPLLVIGSSWTGVALGDWVHNCEARYTDVDYRPPLRTPKPRTHGVESATVTGPTAEEIHTDEFGRIRVHFHWDRDGAADDTSSCWIPVNQPWAGAGFGAINLPRVGQEVLIDFLGADPDRPIVMGRVFTLTTPPPYQLPKHKMVSGLRSESYPRPKSAPAQQQIGGGPGTTTMEPFGGGMPVGPLGASVGPSLAPGGALSAAFSAMPGLRGVSQAPQSILSATVDAMTSKGSDLLDHTRSANAVMFDDTAGSEKLYLQANKDFNQTVKNDHVASVGGNRGATVLGNCTTTVANYETTGVGKDRTVAVGGAQSHAVQGNIQVEGFSNLSVATTKGEQIYVAEKRISLNVGSSWIFLYPDAIVIDAPDVYINPGSAMMESLASGKSPKEGAEAQKKQNEADEKQKQAEVKAQQDAEAAQYDLGPYGGGL